MSLYQRIGLSKPMAAKGPSSSPAAHNARTEQCPVFFTVFVSLTVTEIVTKAQNPKQKSLHFKGTGIEGLSLAVSIPQESRALLCHNENKQSYMKGYQVTHPLKFSRLHMQRLEKGLRHSSSSGVRNKFWKKKQKKNFSECEHSVCCKQDLHE